jgi:CheY-like chemotaxis protein/anti-sigma regulatory factor (Ser/Thr protein kinase)
LKLLFGDIIDASDGIFEIVPIITDKQSQYFCVSTGKDEQHHVSSTFISITDVSDLIAARKKAEEGNIRNSRYIIDTAREMSNQLSLLGEQGRSVISEDRLDRTAIRKFLWATTGAVNSLRILSNNISDYMKFETGEFAITNVIYEFASLINDVVTATVDKIKDKKIEFVVFTESKIPHGILGDDTRIRTMLMHLLDNAVKFTERGVISLKCTMLRDEKDKGKFTLQFEVADTGRGISEENLPNVFSVMFRRRDGDENKLQSKGIGLNIAYRIAKIMDGDMTVESKLGEGTKFTATVKQWLYSDSDGDTPYAELDEPDKYRVLLFDESDIRVRSAKATFENLGAKIDTAITSEKFILRLTEMNHTHIIISAAQAKIYASIIEQGGVLTAVMGAEETDEDLQGKFNAYLDNPLYALPAVNFLLGEEIPAQSVFYAPDARILIVDDMKTNLMSAAQKMWKYNITPTCLESGAECLTLTEKEVFDIIFLDHMMPGIDGLEVLEKLRGRGYTAPIVIFTANAQHGVRNVFKDAGATDFISKPINRAELERILTEQLPKRKMLTEAI